MSVFHYQAEADNKENYNPDLKTFSPQRLVNQKRYKVLKSIVMRNQKAVSSEAHPLKERAGIHRECVEPHACIEDELRPSEACLKDLAFEDETERRFGL